MAQSSLFRVNFRDPILVKNRSQWSAAPGTIRAANRDIFYDAVPR
jgi:hypothetical protein